MAQKDNNPFPYSDSNKRYHTYDYEMRCRFGGKVVKIPLDGGFTCPNIDGTKGIGGCSYCIKEGLPYRGKTLSEQFNIAKEPLAKKWGRENRKEQYIAYFQTFSGTYAAIDRLRNLWEEALSLPHVVGLTIATRADCIDSSVIELLRSFRERTDLTVELGLQTAYDTTARRIGRCHDRSEFSTACEQLREAGIKFGIHLINGLPGESTEMMLHSAKWVAALRPYEVKLHALYLEKGTALAAAYEQNPFPVLSLEEYVSLVCSQIEVMPKETVIGRLTGDGRAERLIEPKWSLRKFCVMNEIDKILYAKNSYQGIRFNPNDQGILD